MDIQIIFSFIHNKFFMYISEKKLRLQARKHIDMQETLIHYHFIHLFKWILRSPKHIQMHEAFRKA